MAGDEIKRRTGPDPHFRHSVSGSSANRWITSNLDWQLSHSYS